MTQTHEERRAIAWRAFLEIFGAIKPRLEEQMLREEGLNLNHYDVLTKLGYFSPEGELRMQRLAKMVFMVSPTGLTRVLDRMEDDGLVERGVARGDRRGVVVRITENGRAVLERVNKSHGPMVEKLFLSHLDDRDTEALTRAFTKILRALKGRDAITVPPLPLEATDRD